MRMAGARVIHVSIMTQRRNVPAALYRQLKSQAAQAGMSLSDYLIGEIRQVPERPTLDEIRVRLASRAKTTLSITPADAVRAERDKRLS